MPHRSRAQRLTAAFAAVADTLASDYSSDELMHLLLTECTAILGVSDGGVMLVGSNGELQPAAFSNEHAWALEGLQLDSASGPALDCHASGETVLASDFHQWPEFDLARRERGITSVLSLPLRHHDRAVGVMTLYSDTEDGFEPDGIAAARGLAGVATIGVLHARELRASARTAEQLKRSLASRVLIEQTKGMLVGTGSGSIEDAQAQIASYARRYCLTQREVAEGIIGRRVLLTDSGLEPAA